MSQSRRCFSSGPWKFALSSGRYDFMRDGRLSFISWFCYGFTPILSLGCLGGGIGALMIVFTLSGWLLIDRQAAHSYCCGVPTAYPQEPTPSRTSCGASRLQAAPDCSLPSSPGPESARAGSAPWPAPGPGASAEPNAQRPAAHLARKKRVSSAVRIATWLHLRESDCR